jgi:hypothetical protein
MTFMKSNSSKKDWADYIRTRRKPVKDCCKCHKTYENTDEFFARAASGWLTTTCVKCAEIITIAQRSRFKLLKGGRTDLCPICDEMRPLHISKLGPELKVMCQRCNTLVNWLAGAPRLTTVQFLVRLAAEIKRRGLERA